MRKLIAIAGAAMLVGAIARADSSSPGQAAAGVLQRSLGARAGDFVFKKMDGQDAYHYEAQNGQVTVAGTDGVAMSRGAYDYLRNHQLGMISWAAPRLGLSARLPDDAGYSGQSPYEFRYYLNAVTYGYTTPYWDWPRWEQEIDWMALHGVNFPLALVATEAIGQRVWKKLGLTQAEVDELFTGPAHLPWNRMGNVSKIGGPLSDAWQTSQIALQHKILARMRELGMHPIAPAFAGFVPPGLLRLHPEVKLHELSWNDSGFPAANHCFMLSPAEPLFQQIGKAFIEEWEKEFGKNDYYIADTFNEMALPKTGRPVTESLADYGDAVYQSIKAGNPAAVWVIQGWMFGDQRENWSPANVQALLSKVPDDKLLILDLACDYNARQWYNGMNYDVFDGFHNKRWIYSVIPNMGGRSVWCAPLAFYAGGPAEAQKSPHRGRLVGIGNAGEGLENNEVLFELMFDTAWHPGAIDVNLWLQNYCRNRYGACPDKMRQAWALFRESCFDADSLKPATYYGWQHSSVGLGTACDNPKFYEGVQHFLACADELGQSPLYRADALELAAAVLAGRSQGWFMAARDGYQQKNPAAADQALATGLQMLTDLDRLLESHPYLRLERWTDFARARGTTPEEKRQYVSEAREIVTTWGSAPINDYSCRLWSGLVRDFYRERVAKVFEGIKTGRPFNLNQWQKEWVAATGVSQVEPFADPMAEAVRLVKAAGTTPVPNLKGVLGETGSKIFDVKSDRPVTTSLRAEDNHRFVLRIENTGQQPATVTLRFPVLRGWGDADAAYCFPQRAALIGTQPVHARARYGGMFPLQFMDVSEPGRGGTYILTQDLDLSNREFWLNKGTNIEMGVDYFPRTIQPGEVWELAAVIAPHPGDWHEALAAYQQWVKTWYHPAVPRHPWFREVFNFRVQFLHFEEPHRSGAFDESSKQWALEAVTRQDAREFGGVDFLHLYDWAWTPDKGRVGDYAPWEYLGGAPAVRSEIGKIQKSGVPVGLYLEGYLVSTNSDLGQAHGAAWQMRAKDGTPVRNWGGEYYHLCPYDEAWQNQFAGTCVRVAAATGAAALYIDEFGFGTQYQCFSPDHGHVVPGFNAPGELQMLRRIRKALPAPVALYTEETPADVTMQFQDGAFSAAVNLMTNAPWSAPVALARFALPDFKTFELVSEHGLGNNRLAVKRTFFNGEGLYLAGLAADWYDPAVLELIRKTHALLREHRDAFTSLNPVPLAPAAANGLYVNMFPAGNETVWTLFNNRQESLAGELLRVKHVPGATYYDAWNDHPIVARQDGAEAVLTLAINPQDVGCVVQRLVPEGKHP